jgi:hypothetical protein
MNADAPDAPPLPPAQPKKRGCFFYGCLTGIILMVVLLVGGLIVTKIVLGRVNQYIAQYSDPSPVALPKTELSMDEMKTVLERVTVFSAALDARSNAAPLVLTAPQVNALLDARPELAAFKGQYFISFEGDKAKAQISLPLDKIKFPGLDTTGRFFNGSGTFDVSISDGLLYVYPNSLEVKGKPIPPEVFVQFQRANLATNANKGPNTNIFQEIDSIQVTNNTLVIRAKAN